MCKEAVGQWLEKPVGGEPGSLTAEYTGLTGLRAQTHSGLIFMSLSQSKTANAISTVFSNTPFRSVTMILYSYK